MIKLPPSRYVLPNLFTLASAFCGFAVIWLSARAETGHQFFMAASLIPVACVLDGFDGRVARWLHGQSEFGVQMDSLADFLAFGVAPACLLYAYALKPLGALGLLLAFSYTAGAMLRLARFNVRAADDKGCSRHFEGLPSPVAGMGMAAIVAVDTSVLNRDGAVENPHVWVGLYALAIGILMVSSIPFRTFKDLQRKGGDPVMVAVTLAGIAIITALENIVVALSALFAVYVTLGLAFGAVRRVRRRRLGTPSRDHAAAIASEDEDEELFEPSDSDEGDDDPRG